MEPQYSSLICFDKWWASDNWWSLFSCQVASAVSRVARTSQVLANAISGKQVPSAKTMFFHQNATSTRFDEFWSQQTPQHHCPRIWYMVESSKLYREKETHRGKERESMYFNTTRQTADFYVQNDLFYIIISKRAKGASDSQNKCQAI